jgi:predicted metal-dependent phosphoesterase TrpH
MKVTPPVENDRPAGGRDLDNGRGVLKVELHSHSGDDPHDDIPYSTRELIDRAAALGYGALAVTLHDRQLDLAPHQAYAAVKQIVLIPGIERTILGKHVLLLNFRREDTEAVQTFDDVRRLKERSPAGLVVAAHPYFPGSSCLGSLLQTHADLFDAVEWNGMFTRTLNFNARAARWAKAHGLPMVGNGDVHRLPMLGTTWSLVDAEPDADAICAAIKAGAVRVEARPHSHLAAAAIIGDLVLTDVLGWGNMADSPWIRRLRDSFTTS